MNIIFCIILFPLIAFLFLSSKQGLISIRKTECIGIISIFMSFIITCFYGKYFINNTNTIIIQRICDWVTINKFRIDFNLFLDGLSLSMLFVVTGVGLLIHIFSAWYMQNKEGYSRFFSYTNLFIASMSVLVLADNFLFMYLGWEGVSVCSYLLIGFYYKDCINSFCAFKAFILTRISDIFLLIGIFLTYKEFNSFNFEEIKFLSSFLNINSIDNLNYITFFLLIGVVGKSAQLPFQTWLTDAMVGPTPVSALIHAATMVTAGVYLIARTHFLFLLTPSILYLVGLLGTMTILISSVSALFQTDIKRILAYSTMSQIGYMFLALGVGAWSAAITHLIVHAIFKALLFLSAGSLILSCKNEKNIFKMSGGLRKKLPFLYVNFLIGGASLVSFPLVTAGFYSKGNILFSVLQNGYTNLFLVSLFCSFLTCLYTFRMIFVIFHSKNFCSLVPCKSGKLKHHIPLFILLLFSTFLGSYISPPLFYVFPFSDVSMDRKITFEIICSILCVSGIYISYYLWIKNTHFINKVMKYKFIRHLSCFFLNGWSFDFFYNLFFVNVYLYISKILSYDPINKIFSFFVKIIQILNFYLLKTSNGYVRSYASSMILGMNLILLFIVVMSV